MKLLLTLSGASGAEPSTQSTKTTLGMYQHRNFPRYIRKAPATS